MAAKILMSTGLLVLIMFILRIFGAGDSFITTDKQWCGMFIIGLLLSITGVFIDLVNSKPMTQEQARRRKVSIQSCKYALFLMIILSCFLMGSLLIF